MNYVDEFLNYDCAGDILNIIPKQKKYQKEITESMSVIKRIKNKVLEYKMEYSILDLCAGNALTSVLSVYTLPVKMAYAIDKKKRKGNYENAKRFQYLEQDINTNNFANWFSSKKGKFILIAVHACSNIAITIIDIFNCFTNIKGLYLMPCCVGNMKDHDYFLRNKLGKYIAWCYQLKSYIHVHSRIIEDKKILSPANIIIEAWKG